MQATLSKLSSVSTFFPLPFDGSSLLAPIATDLSTWDFMQLGWVKFRAGDDAPLPARRHSADIGGGSYIIEHPGEHLGRSRRCSATRRRSRRRPAAGQYAPGCVTGNQQFK